MNRGRSGLIAVVALAILARLILAWPRIGLPADDPDNYLPLAHSLARGHGFEINGLPTAYRPPLYPIVLAIVSPHTGDRFGAAIALLHAILGAITTALTALTARRWGISWNRALIAAGLVALDPVLAVQSRSVMTETLAACLLAAAMAGSAGDSLRSSALGGFAFGLAALCRPSTLPAAGLAAIFAGGTGSGSWARRAARSTVLLLATMAPLVPWAVRNAVHFGEPVFTTTHGGYTLALANNPTYYREVLDGPPGAVWSGEGQKAWFKAITRETLGMIEPESDRFLRRQAMKFIADHPMDFARASLARLGRFWGLAPAAAVYPAPLRLATAIWTAPFWLAVAWGMSSKDLWKWPRSCAPAIVIALTVVHAVFWTDLRMRAPIVPALALIAAIAGSRTARAADLAEEIGKKTKKAANLGVQIGGNR